MKLLKLLCIMLLIVQCTHSDDGDTQAPTAPAHLRVSNITSSSVDLQWDASTDNVGVVEYDVHKGDTLAGTTTDTSYTVTSLSAATDYSFYVVAKDVTGNISEPSNTVNISTLSSTTGDMDKKTEKIYMKSGNLVYILGLDYRGYGHYVRQNFVSVKAADTTISGIVTIPASVTLKGTRYKVAEIASAAFYQCKSLDSIHLPNTVTKIGEFAFSHCNSLTGITMPAVITIERQAFFDCSKLANISIPNSVTTIEFNVFNNCIALKSINIPASVTKIEYAIFYDCKNLEDVQVNWTNAAAILKIEKAYPQFQGISPSAVLHIPAGMKSAYAAKGWTEGFASVVEDVRPL